MMRLSLVALAALGLMACGEQPQVVEYKQGKYAGKPDTTPYSGEQFKGDKAAWQSALRARAENQNEYKRTQ